MRAFAEDLSQFKHVHIIRIGPFTDGPDADWVYSCICASQDGHSALLMAFKSDPDFELSVVTAAVAEARKLGYTRIRWERKKRGRTRTVDATRKSGSTPS